MGPSSATIPSFQHHGEGGWFLGPPGTPAPHPPRGGGSPDPLWVNPGRNPPPGPTKKPEPTARRVGRGRSRGKAFISVTPPPSPIPSDSPAPSEQSGVVVLREANAADEVPIGAFLTDVIGRKGGGVLESKVEEKGGGAPEPKGKGGASGLQGKGEGVV